MAHPVERALAGVVSALLVSWLGWVSYTQMQILQAQSAQIERNQAMGFRLTGLEVRINGSYFYPQLLADSDHRAMQGNINHNWEVIKRLEAQLEPLELRVTQLEIKAMALEQRNRDADQADERGHYHSPARHNGGIR